jgi:hypothetical protein
MRRDTIEQRGDSRVDLVRARSVVPKGRRRDGEQQDECDRESAHLPDVGDRVG